MLRASYDRFRLPYDTRVAHIDINNSTIKTLKRAYLRRTHFAKVIENLSSMEVSAQVYDFIFPARLEGKGDAELINSTRRAGNVYFGIAFRLDNRKPSVKVLSEDEAVKYLDKTKWDIKIKGNPDSMYVGIKPLVTFPELAYASKGLGSLSIRFDRDGVLRRVPLLIRYKDSYYPILPLRVVCDYLDVGPEDIIVEPGKSVTLRNVKDVNNPKLHDIVIPIDNQCNMIVNFIGPWGVMAHYNFADVMLASRDRFELEMWREEMKGKIVVVSDVSTGSTDVGPVPTDNNFPLSGVHTNIINSILTESFLSEASTAHMILIELLILVILGFLSIRFSSLYFSIGTVFLGAVYLGFSVFSFLYWHTIFNVVRPLLMMFIALTSIVVYRYIQEERERMETLRQRDFIRDTFGRYLSNEVVDELLGSPSRLDMGGEIREVTFLVSDLRGFTALSTQLGPAELISILNRYLECMVDVIAGFRGTVNEIEGDGILAFFGAPLKSEDDAERAVACAIEMQIALEKFNEKQRELGLPELSMGIGINTGDVVVGNIGSTKRAKYGAIGSAINTAYRVESYTVGGQILISPSTYERVKSIVDVKDMLNVRFKGLAEPVTLYSVTGINGKYRIHLTEKAPYPFVTLSKPLKVICYELKGKTVSEKPVEGLITRVADPRAEISMNTHIKKLTNLKMDFIAGKDENISSAYSKVISVNRKESEKDRYRIIIEFTYLPENIKNLLKTLKEG